MEFHTQPGRGRAMSLNDQPLNVVLQSWHSMHSRPQVHGDGLIGEARRMEKGPRILHVAVDHILGNGEGLAQADDAGISMVFE